MNNNTGPLKGLRILDLTRILAGPSCTQLLGDLGAEVIKIERPGSGDDTRGWGPPFVQDVKGNPTTESAYYLGLNRNKKSVAVDIASEEGAKIVRKILANCDILVENFKTGGLNKYGLSYDQLAEEFPNLIYCSITGYGHTGPNATKAGYDLMIQGWSGLMSLTGHAGEEPVKVGIAIADLATGLYASTAILAALRHRDQTGEGQHIDLALADVQTAWLTNQGQSYLTSGKVPQRLGNQHPTIVPYQVFEVADGYVIAAVGNDTQYQRFCDVIGCAELATDPRFVTNKLRVQNRDILVPLLAAAIIKHDQAPLIAAMEEQGVPTGPIHTLDQVFATDQVAAREMAVEMHHPASDTDITVIGNPMKFSKTPVSYRSAPPACGQDTDDVLAALGLDEG